MRSRVMVEMHGTPLPRSREPRYSTRSCHTRAGQCMLHMENVFPNPAAFHELLAIYCDISCYHYYCIFIITVALSV
jgi:hypothetical protein